QHWRADARLLRRAAARRRAGRGAAPGPAAHAGAAKHRASVLLGSIHRGRRLAAAGPARVSVARGYAMIGPLRAVAVIVTLVIAVPPSGAQPPSAAPSSQAALDEAKQLNQQVEKLYKDGKYQDALAPAERALALRENALGPGHPDVAQSLNNLGNVYEAQGE